MMDTAYAVAFDGNRYLMVWHNGRGGWEMPGGHIEPGESPEEACVREFREEAGYAIEIVGTRDIGHCYVCAAILGSRMEGDCEMESCLFAELPEKLSFDREEYECTVPWARETVARRGRSR